ncbi:uncharacterized protein LOC123563485 isoform X1 [Mercenaria mercenaria]|uniref:uncharacterized protein LOC123563485 isoform X1 n=1 Tax=Mercenaria mercenaria TaxID=6596 RepID=UPI00234F30AA|nr:uncharacterized protein LOC123563485 isoform X1 [Mercenaria mercenaria]
MKTGIIFTLTLVYVITSAKTATKVTNKIRDHANDILSHSTVLAATKTKTLVLTTVKGESKIQTRNVLTDPTKLWSQGKIPFIFDENVPAFTKIELLAAMQEIEMSAYSGHKLCAMFVPRSTETDYVHIAWTSGLSGSTSIGRVGGRQEMTVNSAGGRGHDDNLEILLMTMGLIPEIMRPDRDTYLNININNAVSSNPFRVLTGTGTSDFGQHFDYDSLVLGNPYQFAIDAAYPVTSAKQSGKVMGQSVSMTTGDVTLLQHAYHCTIDSSHDIDLLGTLPLECHFHTDICSFTQDHTDDFDWVVQAGPTATSGTGPNADYSSGSGKFALAQAVNHHNQVARLASPTFNAGEYCLRVNLHMFGRDIGALKIAAVLPSGLKKYLLNHSGQLGKGWYHIYSTINSKSSFHLQIEATIGSGDQGDIAIDDVYMYNGECIEWD